MTTKRTIFRVPLVNVNIIGQRCGYGEGPTLEAAQQDALAQARKLDRNAKLSKDGQECLFWARCLC